VGFEIEGRPSPEEWRQQSARLCAVTPGYFSTLGIPLLRGRDVRDSDVGAGSGVVVISEAVAQRHWRDENPVGQRIKLGSNEPWLTIVGIVGDTRYGGPGTPAIPTVYVPYAQSSWPWAMFIVVRTGAEPGPIVSALRRGMRQMGADAPLTGVALMDERIADTLAVERSVTSGLVAFALFAVALAAVGLYGVIAHSVALRTRELGVRLALGATRRQLLRMVLWRALVLTASGVAWGLLLASIAARGTETLLHQVDPLDPRVFAAVFLLLVLVALAASYLPARRAASVDPLKALRSS
jgi:putative ABC transport system permease protein